MTASESDRFNFRIPIISTMLSNMRHAMRDSFVFKRRPKWNMDREWTRPPDQQYKQELHWQGFIAIEHWNDDDLSQNKLITQDLADLEEYLMPIFWEFNQKAKFYQNEFYKYQWIFMFGAFFTTILAVLTGYYGALPEGDVRFFFLIADETTYTNVFGLLTTLISAVTSYYTVLSNQGEPRKRWASYRRLAEELRMTYFMYISRMDPYHRANRIDVLRRRVLELRRQEKENG